MADIEGGWVQFDLKCAAEAAEELAAELAARWQTAVEVTAGGVRLYLAQADWSPEREQALRAAAADLGGVAAPASFTATRIADQDWGVTWKRHFKPLRVGRHFVIVPSWESYSPLAADRILHIDPGQAFGTGHHETTRLCLEWLEDHGDRETPGSLLDLGTGSGILAIAAGMLGFHPITAVDIDPEAVRAARENAARNSGASQIHWLLGEITAVDERYDTVMANIQAAPLIAMAAALNEHLAPAGRLVLSGVLTTQADMVVNAYRVLDLTLNDRREDGEWCLLEWRRDRRR